MLLHFFALSALVNAITSFLLGMLVFMKNPRGKVNRTYGLTTFFITFWSFSYYFWQISRVEHEALFWCRALMAGAIFLPVAYLQFISSLLELRSPLNQRIVKAGYGISLLFFLSNFTTMFVKGVSPRLIFPFWPDAGVLFLPFLLIVYCAFIGYAVFILINGYQQSIGIKRNQVKYVLLGCLIGFGGGATNYPLWYDIPVLPVCNIFVSAGICIMAYAIIRYRLMDITVAITRTGIFIAVYSLVLGAPFAVAWWARLWLIEHVGQYWWTVPLGLMAALATVGPFLYIYFERRAEANLLREQRHYQDTLKQASVGMTRIRNLRKLLDLIAHIVTKTVRISYAAVYLFNKESGEFVLQVSRDKGRLSVPKVKSDNSLIEWMLLKHEPILLEEVGRQAQELRAPLYRKLESNMRLLFASVVIPCFLEDRLLGFIVLGDKVSGQAYTPEDLNVFQVLATQAALAIENAQFYEETRQMQEQIAQAEKMATIGTMADGLSHQINNRFYALSLIAGDTIDTIKTTDTQRCTPEIREMIRSVSHALDRIQSNVMQGGEVVKGILKYTRKGSEGLENLSLDRIIDGTLDMVQYKVKLSEIDLIRDYPKDLAPIRGNLVQLQEVFFNLIDNAYDAINERKQARAEEGFRGRIVIGARSLEAGKVEVVVEDNGMGVKDPLVKKLFTPFFTTKTSNRKGTGLGLYVINKIITEGHKGAIQVESRHGIGTRFILTL